MHRYELDDGTCIANPGAGLTLDSPTQFKAFVVDLLENQPIDRLIINFELVNRIDSFGIGVIVGLFKLTREKGKRFGLSNVSKAHRELFSMTGVDKVIDIYDSSADAVAAMRG